MLFIIYENMVVKATQSVLSRWVCALMQCIECVCVCNVCHTNPLFTLAKQFRREHTFTDSHCNCITGTPYPNWEYPNDAFVFLCFFCSWSSGWRRFCSRSFYVWKIKQNYISLNNPKLKIGAQMHMFPLATSTISADAAQSVYSTKLHRFWNKFCVLCSSFLVQTRRSTVASACSLYEILKFGLKIISENLFKTKVPPFVRLWCCRLFSNWIYSTNNAENNNSYLFNKNKWHLKCIFANNVLLRHRQQQPLHTSKVSGVVADSICFVTNKQKPIDKRKTTKIYYSHFACAPPRHQRAAAARLCHSHHSRPKRSEQIKKKWFAVCPFLRRVHEKDYLLLWPCSTVDACFYVNVSSVFGIYKVINLFTIPIQAVFVCLHFLLHAKAVRFFLLATVRRIDFHWLLLLWCYIVVHRSDG